jgi:hypothetical protein
MDTDNLGFLDSERFRAGLKKMVSPMPRTVRTICWNSAEEIRVTVTSCSPSHKRAQEKAEPDAAKSHATSEHGGQY